jgi:hypothetical protein
MSRAEVGTHHHIAGPYLAAYAAEMDWREDNRWISNGEQYAAIVTAAAAHPVSRTWKGIPSAHSLSGLSFTSFGASPPRRDFLAAT